VLQYKDVDSIIDHKQINAALESTKKASQDPVAIKAILEAAKDRSFLTNYTPGELVLLHIMPVNIADVFCSGARA
jgi:hypothetical protein